MELKFPSLEVGHEHIYYVIEGAMLQLFGEDSYDVFMHAAHDFPMHSLAHTSVQDFIVQAVVDSEPHPKTKLDKIQLMLQFMCVRRCLFAPLFTRLCDCFTPDTLRMAIDEDRDENAEAPMRDAIGKTIGEIFIDLAEDDKFSPYLEGTDATRDLERKNLAQLLSHCAIYADETDIRMVLAPPKDFETSVDFSELIDNFLVSQYEFVPTIMMDYLSRDIAGNRRQD